MREFLGKPQFSFGDSGGEAVEIQFLEDGAAYKITSQDRTEVVFTGKDGVIAGAKFEKGKILVVPIFYEEPHAIQPCLKFYENYGTISSVHAELYYGVMVGFPVNMVFELDGLNLGALFLARRPGSYKIMSTNDPVRPEALDAFVITIPKSAASYTVCLGMPYVTDTMPETNIPDEPQVDSIGQWTRKTWAGKTKNEEEMVSNYRTWLSEADAQPVHKGYSSGFFTTAARSGLHTLLDPDGKPFFSVGMDCVRPWAPGPVTGIESLLEELPPKDGKYAPAWSEITHSHSAEYKASEYDFFTANLIKAFGDKWYNVWNRLTAHRLKSWGFNTIANWSDLQFARNSGIPYVTETPFPDTRTALFRDFPDVFSPEYEANAAKCAEYLTEYKDDHNLIGYFLRNEPNFAFGDYNIALFMLQSEADSCSRREFIGDMKKKYSDDICVLNKGWGTDFSSFEELSKPLCGTLTPESEDCLNAFTKKLFRQYIKIPSLACKAVDPNHLNLGLRWAWIASENFYEGAEYVDVFSINCYEVVPEPELIAKISGMSGGKPVIIGEFHMGALDAGLPANGIRAVTDQSERGYFYSYYIENGAAVPELVGAHYFQYNDQPVLGRYDGECCNIGFVDVCGKPYEKLVARAAESHAKIEDIRSGKVKPTARKALAAPKEGF